MTGRKSACALCSCHTVPEACQTAGQRTRAKDGKAGENRQPLVPARARPRTLSQPSPDRATAFYMALLLTLPHTCGGDCVTRPEPDGPRLRAGHQPQAETAQLIVRGAAAAATGAAQAGRGGGTRGNASHAPAAVLRIGPHPAGAWQPQRLQGMAWHGHSVAPLHTGRGAAHRAPQPRRCASFHIQNGQSSVSAPQSSVVTCTKRLSSNSLTYCAQASPGAAAAWRARGRARARGLGRGQHAARRRPLLSRTLTQPGRLSKCAEQRVSWRLLAATWCPVQTLRRPALVPIQARRGTGCRLSTWHRQCSK
jgi:hypothetical protein